MFFEKFINRIINSIFDKKIGESIEFIKTLYGPSIRSLKVENISDIQEKLLELEKIKSEEMIKSVRRELYDIRKEFKEATILRSSLTNSLKDQLETVIKKEKDNLINDVHEIILKKLYEDRETKINKKAKDDRKRQENSPKTKG